MGVQREFYPFCDLCGESCPDILYDSVKLVRISMRKNGWMRRGNNDYCPDCVIKEELK